MAKVKKKVAKKKAAKKKVAKKKVDEKKKSKLLDIHNRMLRKVKNAEKQIKFFNDNAECPTCSQDINDTIIDNRIESLSKSI